MKSWDRLCLIAARSEGLLIDFILVFFIRWGLKALGLAYFSVQPVLDGASPPFQIADFLDEPVSAIFYGTMYFASGLPEVFTAAIWFVYAFLCLSIFGQTLGMRQAEVRLVNEKGTRPGLLHVFIRQVFAPLSAICWIGIWPIVFTVYASTLHDLISGTRVVYVERPSSEGS